MALIVPFILLFLVLLAGGLFIMSQFGVAPPRRRRIAAVLATAPVLLLVLQSLGQLTVRDTLGIFVLFSLTYFYIVRVTSWQAR
jgi:hypothetical protein